MKNIHIYHHLGLGDHIICNGLVRQYATLYNKVYLFCKPHNVDNVSYMFRDKANIKLLSANDDETMAFIDKNKQNNYLIIGHEELTKRIILDLQTTFDSIFYGMAYIPIEYKWDKFYFARDIEKEKDVFYNKLGMNDSDKFIFIHDDIERPIPIHKLPQNFRVIRPDNKDISILDFLYTIEKSREVHMINSCLFNLIDCIKLRNCLLYTSPSPRD